MNRGTLYVRNRYNRQIEYTGPLTTDLDREARLPEAVRRWVLEARRRYEHLDEERFLRYLAVALPTSMELLMQGYLVSVDPDRKAPHAEALNEAGAD
ncbi:hypothetical protein [Oceanithermus profundus]|uniref:Uncharacterized protein n=1 Tax=Oceanithermus profundus (strain DSM 14977 / NBRC 100410 / VKM B-2274 / 506) TaxID=670487 RepID=E4U656_OCEP5|nr:hypothetical protein [Oceanithermus profundus]ADR35929.1 hypothetical protein Ocepr_0470 [Oceanithermus profundus DSM 14977]